MPTPVLRTKLYVPPVPPELVPRPHLTERLDAGLHRKLTHISAPAGFGKTTLLSEWAARCDRPVVWVSLDEDDNDPVRFLAYLIAALQTMEESIGEGTLDTVQSPQPPPIANILTSLINEITAIAQTNEQVRPFVLILDDYHVVRAQSIHDSLAFLVDHLPPQMHLVIATRQDPPLPLARLRDRGHMSGMRASDLRFREEEVAAFLNETMQLDLKPDEIAALETRTEGWIAGLHLAALSLRGQVDRAAFIQAFAGDDRHVMDYLVSEVLSRQPESVRCFLLSTAILDRFCAPLCDAVIGCDTASGGSQDILEYLERANLFIVPLDGRRQWYRYHHLFAELLRHRLRRTVGPESIARLHRRASVWYSQNDLISEAIAHSLAADDSEQAARLIGHAFENMCSRGEYYTTMLRWLEALPDEFLRTRADLGILYVWMLSISLQLDAAEARLQEIESTASGLMATDFRLHTVAIRATLARQRNDLSKATQLSHQVLEDLAKASPERNLLARTGAVFNLAWVRLMTGDVTGASERFREALALSQAAGSITLTLDAMRGLARVHIAQGQLRQAVEIYQEALQLSDKVGQRNGQDVPAAAPVHLELGNLFREQNRLDEATHHLAQGIQLSHQCQILADDLRNGYIYQARLKQALGDTAGALAVIRLAESLAQTYRNVPQFGEPIAACQARLMLAQIASDARSQDPGSLVAVDKWAKTRGLTADGAIELLDDELEYLIWVRLLIAEKHPIQALRLLARLLPAAESSGRHGRVIEILALKALGQQALGDIDQALCTLARALSLGQPEGYVRLFVDEGRPMARLLYQAVQRDSAADYARWLLAGFEIDTNGQLPGLTLAEGRRMRAGGEALIERLSQRELEVLGLIAQGLTNREVATRLFLTLNTVKVHSRNIYAKLNVHSRTEAVARARSLDILQRVD